MNKSIPAVALTLSLMLPGLGLWAEDTMHKTEDAIEHPVTTYHEHEVKSDAATSQEFTQQKAEAKARLDQAKKDYEKSLAANGANNEVTKQAKKRLADARKEYKKYAKKSAQASQELGEDAQKLNNDKATQ